MPFAGCPNKCSFCDQHRITGVISKTTPEDVKNTISTALSSGGIDASASEIAFFGGSFTAVDRKYMTALLQSTRDYIHYFKGIRISTRPDCIDEEILDFLRGYGVTSIELGAQSMSDEVLTLNRRGHNAQSVYTASKLIKDMGFSLGLQMMTGLYGSSREFDIYTAKEFISINPDTVRIYPTIVLKGTYLEELASAGVYKPQTVEEAVDLCSELIPMFESSDIKLIRVGLHSSDTMEDSIISGAYHPAFRELCESRIYLNNIIRTVNMQNYRKGNIKIFVPSRDVSKAIGQKRNNLTVLQGMGYNASVVGESTLNNRQIIIQEG